MNSTFKTLALATTIAASGGVAADQCVSGSWHDACLSDDGILMTKSPYYMAYLGHSNADDTFHEANVPHGGLQVEAGPESTIVRHSDGLVYALGGLFSTRMNEPLVMSLTGTTDIAVHDREVYMVKNSVVYKRDNDSRWVGIVDGLPEVSDIESGDVLGLLGTDGTRYTYDSATGSLEELAAPTIFDVQPGGSYIITGTDFGDVAGTVTMNGFTFELKSWVEGEVHIENPPEWMTGELVITSADGRVSDGWYVSLDPYAPSDTDIGEADVCPVPEQPEVVTEIVEVEVIREVEVVREVEVPVEVIVTETVEVPVEVIVTETVEVPVEVIREVEVTVTETVEVARDLTMSELLALIQTKASESRESFRALKAAAKDGKKASQWFAERKAEREQRKAEREEKRKNKKSKKDSKNGHGHGDRNHDHNHKKH